MPYSAAADDQVALGFTRLLAGLDDLALDIPDAAHLLELFLGEHIAARPRALWCVCVCDGRALAMPDAARLLELFLGACVLWSLSIWIIRTARRRLSAHLLGACPDLSHPFPQAAPLWPSCCALVLFVPLPPSLSSLGI